VIRRESIYRRREIAGEREKGRITFSFPFLLRISRPPVVDL
jgi:hypothetical protein